MAQIRSGSLASQSYLHRKTIIFSRRLLHSLKNSEKYRPRSSCTHNSQVYPLIVLLRVSGIFQRTGLHYATTAPKHSKIINVVHHDVGHYSDVYFLRITGFNGTSVNVISFTPPTNSPTILALTLVKLTNPQQHSVHINFNALHLKRK